jgi:hypothetical protein
MSDTSTAVLAPGPEITDLNRPYWDALKEGRHHLPVLQCLWPSLAAGAQRMPGLPA